MTVPRCGTAPFLLLSLSLIGTGFVVAAGAPPGQQEAVEETRWMDPPRSALIEAARRGYEGNVLSPLVIYEDSEAVCQRSVVRVSVRTPIHLAHEIGFRRKENSDTPPAKAHTKPAVRTARVSITFGSSRANETMEAGFTKNGFVYRSDAVSLDSTKTVLCGERETFIHTITVTFRGKQSLLKKGRIMFFFQRKSGARSEFGANFNNLR